MKQKILATADKKLVNSLCELSDNILAGNIKLSPAQFKCISKHKNLLRRIVKRGSLQSKRKYLSQKGGFLQYIIPAAISGISSLLGNLFNQSGDGNDESIEKLE